MSNTITIELCAEDRARLDRLAEALERRTCDKCVATVTEYLKTATMQTEPKPEPDPIQQKLAETLAKMNAPAEPAKNAPEEAEPSTQATTPTEQEKPTGAENAQPEPTKKVTHADVKSMYIKLTASGKRESAKAIIIPISATISGIPEDRLNEVYKKLVALEG